MLKSTGLNKKNWLAALFFAVFLLTMSAQPAHASLPFIGDFLNYTQSAMSGLADLGGWVFAVFTFLFVSLGISWGAVSLSAALLEWSIKIPIVLEKNPIVKTGWDFTLGLTNLLLVLIFIGIAMAFILNKDTYGLKKALPKLIAVALLINFSLLFVGIFADVATIFQNTILKSAGLGGGEGLITGATGLTIQSTQSYIFKLVTLGTGSMALLAIPGIDVGTMIARIGLFLAFTPQLVSAFFIIFFNSILSLIYLFYFILFIGRIFVFWILAVLAPLAFLAAVLPATKKYFDQWLRTLIHWAFLGIIALFLLTLGLQLINISAGDWLGISKDSQYPFSPTEFSHMHKYVLYYSILAVYLVFVLFATKKLASKSAGIVWGAGSRGFRTAGKAAASKGWGVAQEKMKTGAAAERVGQWAARKPGLGTVIGKPLLGYAERRRGEFETGEKAVQSWRSENIAAQIGRMPELQRAGALKVLAERGHANQIKEEDQIKILMAAKAAGKEKDIIKFLPQHAEKIGFKDGIDGALRAQKPADIEKLDKSLFENPSVVKRIPHVYSPDKLGKLSYHGSETISRVQKAFKNEYDTNRDELIKNNRAGLRYTHSAMGSSLFEPVGSLEEIEGKAKGGGTRPTPPAGVPSNWVPGPGGTWVPPPK